MTPEWIFSCNFMDEAQTSYFGFAMLRAVNVHLVFKLQDAAWKTQWRRWWTLHINYDPSKVCLARNCRIRPKHRIIPKYQNLQDQTKTAAVEVKLRLIFLTTAFAVHVGQFCGKGGRYRFMVQCRHFPADFPARLHGSDLIKKATSQKWFQPFFLIY